MSKGLEAKLNEITFCHGCKYENAPKEECPCVLIKKELKALAVLRDMLQLKVYENKLGQCFLEGTNILIAIDHETYSLLKEVLLCQNKD